MIKFKKVRNPEKQKKLWDKLMLGDKEYEECGEPWDKWNTETIPIRTKMKEIKAARKIYDAIHKLDKNNDGVLSKEDYKKN